MGQQKVRDTSQNKTPPFKMGWVWVSPLKYSLVRGQLLAIAHGSVLKPIQARVQKHQHSSNYLQKSRNSLHANKEWEDLAHSHRLTAATVGRGSQAPTLGKAQSRKHGDFQASDFPYRQMLRMS